MSAHPELADRIEQHAAEIAQRAFAAVGSEPVAGVPLHAMFAPPRVSHDIAELVRTLRNGDAPGMLAYVHRLQRTLPNEGLTTRHLARGFRRLHDAILAIGLSDAGAARTMLDRAVLALRYDGSNAAALQDASRQVAEDAVVALRGVRLGDTAVEAEWIEAMELMISYLADALATQRPELLSGHAQRLASLAPSAVRPAEPAAMLSAIEGALDELPPAARTEAARYLAAARAALAVPAG